MKGSIELSTRQIVILLIMLAIAVIILMLSFSYSSNIKLWHQNITNVTF